VTLHFAYGSNMNRSVMHKHAPEATLVGTAALKHYRFVITADGYASIVPKRTAVVYGVLWRLHPRDRAALDAWENVAAGLYRKEVLPLQHSGRRQMALTYIARPGSTGRPKAGYMQLVIAAALEWRLPQAYIASLRQWLPRRPGSEGPRKLREFEWT